MEGEAEEERRRRRGVREYRRQALGILRHRTREGEGVGRAVEGFRGQESPKVTLWTRGRGLYIP